MCNYHKNVLGWDIVFYNVIQCDTGERGYAKYISVENQKILNSISLFYKDSTFNFIDLSEKIVNLKLERYMSVRDDYNYISIETYFRFFIPQLFPNYKKMLYLDADILVFDDLRILYNEDISDYCMGVVQDTYLEVILKNDNIKMQTRPNLTYKEYFKQILGKLNIFYFNAGVLLLNLEKMRNDNIVKNLWEFSEKNAPLEYQDQDVLNAILESKVKFLDSKWNVLTGLEWVIPEIPCVKKKRVY